MNTGGPNSRNPDPDPLNRRGNWGLCTGGVRRCGQWRTPPRHSPEAAPDLAWLPSGTGGPSPTQNLARRRWQRHLHIWRPCSRFRDGARAALTSPRTMRVISGGGDLSGTYLPAWRRGRKRWDLQAVAVRLCVKTHSQSSSPYRVCVVFKAGVPRQSGRRFVV